MSKDKQSMQNILAFFDMLYGDPQNFKMTQDTNLPALRLVKALLSESEVTSRFGKQMAEFTESTLKTTGRKRKQPVSQDLKTLSQDPCDLLRAIRKKSSKCSILGDTNKD